MKKIKYLPTKYTIVLTKNKKQYIRQQHYNPDKDKNKNYNKDKLSDYLILDKELHNKIQNKLRDLNLLDKSYYVGGLVRDSILGNKSHDIDIVIEKPTKKDIELLDKKYEKTGNLFPVYRINIGKEEIELALARRERKSGKGHTGFEVSTGEDVSIEDDLLRRDLTINAMAVSVNDPNKLIDPFGGMKDLKNGIIRHVSNAFSEDPLRVFRVARFGARFGFKVAPETIELMKSMKNELKDLPAERITNETEKAFIQSKKPSEYFNILREAGVLDVWFPEISQMIGIEQNKKYHPEGDVYNHTMLTIDELAQLGVDKSTFWGGLFHDVGKILTPKDIIPKHINHDKRGLELLNKIFDRYKFSNKIKKVIRDSIKFHMLIPRISEMRLSKILNLTETLYKNKTLNNVILVSIADRINNRGGINNEIISIIKSAVEVITEKIPFELTRKFKGKKGEEIKNLILQYRINRFKSLLK